MLPTIFDIKDGYRRELSLPSMSWRVIARTSRTVPFTVRVPDSEAARGCCCRRRA